MFWLSKSFTKTDWANTIRENNFGRIADWFTAWFFGTGAGALIAVSVAAYLGGEGKGASPSLGIRIFALGLLLAGACTMVGWLAGLLFGIPRSLSRAAPASPPAVDNDRTQAAADPPSRVNTNLEDISDWLTKTIVGVGLTQFYKLWPLLGDLGHNVNQFGFVWNPYGNLLAIGEILYFMPGGFWLSYVGTRTILTKLFDLIDGGLPAQQLQQAAKLEITEGRIRSGDVEQTSIDQKLLAKSAAEVTDLPEILAWAGAQARAGNLTAARIKLESTLLERPSNIDLRQQLATIYSALKDFDKAREMLKDTPDTPTKMFSALYEPPPQGFTEAIRIGESLVQNPKYTNDANVHVWLACAYAQKYGYEKAKGADQDELDEIKKKVLVDITTATRLQPWARAELYDFWHPKKGSPDDDLSWFDPNDPEIGALLNPPGTPAAQITTPVTQASET